MDKLQEIISDLSLWHLASKEELKPLNINTGPCYIIEKSYVKDIMIGYMRKQQVIIEEHQRQQDIAVNQFRQAQEEISRLRGELKQAHEKSSNHLDEWRRAETQTAKISDELMNMKVLLRAEQGKVRQAQEEIQRLTKENGSFKQALEKIAALKPLTNNDTNACNFQFAITTANLALEGDAE